MRRVACTCVLALAMSRDALAQDKVPPKDDFSVHLGSETTVRLFQRALLPGPNGAIVQTDTQLPITEYLSFKASEVDLPWQKDAISVEASAWGNVTAGNPTGGRYLDGDVQSLNVKYDQGPIWVRAGRQGTSTGPLRFFRFDGLSGGVSSHGFGAMTFFGFTVLPRWSGQPGYSQLGSAADTLLKDPTSFPQMDRGGTWVAGVRGFFEAPRFATTGISFIEQHENAALARRAFGVDFKLDKWEAFGAGAHANIDVDRGGLIDGRLWIDTMPVKEITVTGEVMHMRPSLFLSRQSIFSVFSTSTFSEAGGVVELHVTKSIDIAGAGYGDVYETGWGSRGEGRFRWVPDSQRRMMVQFAYGRTGVPGIAGSPDNGYHSIRTSLRYRFAPIGPEGMFPLTFVADLYGYIYDQPIQGMTTSEFLASSVEWTAAPALKLLLGASVASTPYARLDFQTLMRLTYEFGAGGRR